MLKIVYKRHLNEIKTKKRVFRQLMCTFAKQKINDMIDTSAFQGKTAVYYLSDKYLFGDRCGRS